MIVCPKCGHNNLPSYATCSRCGGTLGGGVSSAVQDDYARMLAERAATKRRNRNITFGLTILVAAFVAYRWVQDSSKKSSAQAKLDYVSRWVDLEKRETGQFWNCAMASEVDVGMFANAGQIQQRVESAYATQQQTFSEHLLTECVPKMERARQAFTVLRDAPPELKTPLDAYQASLPAMQQGIELYAERIKNRAGTKDVDQLIQELGNAWHSEIKPTPETIAYEKFMYCAIPGLERMKDAQQMLEYMADTCYKKDPVSFMDRVRKQCGPLLANVDGKAAPSKTYKLSHKKFFEDDARQLSAWDSCGRKARKGKKVEDLGEFLVAVGDYMAARALVVDAARSIEASVK